MNVGANANNTQSDGVERPIITTKMRIEMRSKKKKKRKKKRVKNTTMYNK